jgi:hypothetical protein
MVIFPLKMVIFHSYVSLPEDKSSLIPLDLIKPPLKFHYSHRKKSLAVRVSLRTAAASRRVAWFKAGASFTPSPVMAAT